MSDEITIWTTFLTIIGTLFGVFLGWILSYLSKYLEQRENKKKEKERFIKLYQAFETLNYFSIMRIVKTIGIDRVAEVLDGFGSVFYGKNDLLFPNAPIIQNMKNIRLLLECGVWTVDFMYEVQFIQDTEKNKRYQFGDTENIDVMAGFLLYLCDCYKKNGIKIEYPKDK